MDGGWPLGMELHSFQEHSAMPLEEFEQRRQQRLLERWERLRHKVDVAVVETMLQRPPDMPKDLETRQWDYKSGVKNPLFRNLIEEERQALLLGTTNPDFDRCMASPSEQLLSSSPPTKSRRSRSNSLSGEFNSTYDQASVHNVRNELEQLRNARTQDGGTGCSCRKLTVYIPPSDGSGGKRAQHRRLKPQKLTQELKKRGLYDPHASREQLEHTLHDAVEQEPCCYWADDCACARNGIECQADACACWHDSHVHEKKTAARLKVDEIQRRCGNTYGMEVVNIEAIELYREQVLTALVCQPVGQ